MPTRAISWKVQDFQDFQDFKSYSIYKCNERPPAQNTRHTTIGNVINMSN